MFLAENFRVVTPETGSTEVSITPVISWTSVNSVTEYTMEISTAYSFASSNIVHSAVYTGTEVTTGRCAGRRNDLLCEDESDRRRANLYE